jgi:ubiquitin C-terminal hydrolase
MTAINQAFNNYFHIIRHPKEAERKRDKLLTAIAILSCITVVVPLAMGIGYALAGRVKRREVESAPPPIGFKNYGNACWFTSAIQVLLASRHFEAVIGQPLEQKDEETENDFEARRGLQTDFLDFLHAAKASDSHTMNKAVKRLHKRICERPSMLKIPKIGSRGDAYRLFDCLHYVTGSDYCFGAHLAFGSDSKSDIQFMEFTSKRFVDSKIAPKMFYFLRDDERDLGLDSSLNLSGGFGNAEYRLVGVCKSPWRGHDTATVLRNGQWYDCDDARVKLHNSNILHFRGGSRFLFELQED